MDARIKNRQEDYQGFKMYREIQYLARKYPTGTLYVVFYFEEKVVLHSILRKPGQINFVTGLEFDMCMKGLDKVKKGHMVTFIWNNTGFIIRSTPTIERSNVQRSILSHARYKIEIKTRSTEFDTN